MGIKDRFQGMLPEKYQPPLEVSSIADFAARLKEGRSPSVVLTLSETYIPQEAEGVDHRFDYYLALQSATLKGRKVSHRADLGGLPYKQGLSETRLNELRDVAALRTLLI
jgi:hypothetical protein